MTCTIWFVPFTYDSKYKGCHGQSALDGRQTNVCLHAGGYHELLLGPEKDEVITLVTEWILAHATPAPAARL